MSLSYKSPRPLPPALMIAGSVFAMGHLTAIVLLVLEPQSGPWGFYGGVTPMEGPVFAKELTANVTFPYYLQPLHMTSTYHFTTNRPAPYAAYFEVIMKDDQGGVMKTLKFPDDKANFWVRHRQELLARNLAEDQPVPPPPITEELPAPGQKIEIVEIWDDTDPDMWKLKKVPEDKVPRRPTLRPTDGAKISAQAYMKYLCREHNAASAELIRYSRETVTPTDMFDRRQRGPNFFTVLKCNFGEYRREK